MYIRAKQRSRNNSHTAAFRSVKVASSRYFRGEAVKKFKRIVRSPQHVGHAVHDDTGCCVRQSLTYEFFTDSERKATSVPRTVLMSYDFG